MKIVCFFLLAFLTSGSFALSPESWGPSGDLFYGRKTFTPPPDIFAKEYLDQVFFSDSRLESQELKKAKYHLLNGETRLARIYLNRIARSKTKLRPVIYRYLAMLSFIEGEYVEAYRHLSQPELQNIPHFGKICVIKTLTEIILDKKVQLVNDWASCKVQNLANFNPTRLVWIDTLVQLKAAPRPGISKEPFESFKLSRYEIDDLKIVLKLALYLNQEELVASVLTDLTFEQIQDEEVRELAGMIYFRSGTFSTSYKFIEDVSSPNAENIKGNLYLLRKKYELAYAQFKLALEQKQNSQNAMERILPLAWLLGDWKSGVTYAERVIASPQTQINKMTLLAAFLTQSGDYKRAKKLLENISDTSKKGSMLDVTQLHSFVALMENDKKQAIKSAGRSCVQSDIINCWVLFQMGQWENFPLTLRRDDPIVVEPLWENLTQEVKNEPLKETAYINQLDIEELDDKLIRLLPKTP